MDTSVAQPQPNGSGGGEVPAGRAVRRRGHQQGLAVSVCMERPAPFRISGESSTAADPASDDGAR